MPNSNHPKHSHLPAPEEGEPIVLALETSCDETAASVVKRRLDGSGAILSNIVLSQVEDHRAFGGVVPEIAARAHVNAMDSVIKAALNEAGVDFADLHAIAATSGPGLNGGLLVATMSGKAIAHARALPFYPINHLEGHALTARLTDLVPFPYCLLLVSGGHTQIIFVHGVGHYERIATTIDDALGEAFDKTAKMLGLDYPGGPAVEKMAKGGLEDRFEFPRPMLHHNTLNLSLSGLKTAVRLSAEKHAPLDEQHIKDICASFQKAICDILHNRVERSLDLFDQRFGKATPSRLVIAGGVAANQSIRAMLEKLCTSRTVALCAPPLNLCTDNAAMIAWAALERIALGEAGDLTFQPRPRWPLDKESAGVVGSGKRGAKV